MADRTAIDFSDMSLDELNAFIGAAVKARDMRVGTLKDEADYEAVERNVAALREMQGAPMFDAFKAQVLLALILRQPNKQLTLTVDEIDRTGGWTARMAVDLVQRTFTFVGSKHS